MPSLRDLLSEVLSGPQRGAKTTLSSVQNLRELLGQSFFPKEYDSMGNEVNAGIAPFFGLPKAPNLFEGIAARPPQGIQEIPMRGISGGIESYRDPFIHIPDRNLTIIPKDQNIGRDSYSHADLAEAYGHWLRDKGYHDTAKRDVDGSIDLWHGNDKRLRKKAPIQGEVRHKEVDMTYEGKKPIYSWRDLDTPKVNLFTTKQQSDPEMLARLRERYPKAPIRADGWDDMAEVEVRQAKKKASRVHPGRKVEKPYSQRRRSGR